VLRTTTVQGKNRFLVHEKKFTGDDECIARENMLRAAGSIELNKFVCVRALSVRRLPIGRTRRERAATISRAARRRRAIALFIF